MPRPASPLPSRVLAALLLAGVLVVTAAWQTSNALGRVVPQGRGDGGLEPLLVLALAVAAAGWALVIIKRLLREQHAAREALHDALRSRAVEETRYRTLFTALPRPAWVYDQETLRFLAVNPAAVAQYGWSEAEFLALRITDIRPADDRARVTESARLSGAALIPARRWQHTWKDGSLRDVLVTTHAIAFGSRPARLAVVDDVTDQLLAERALRSSESRFRAAMSGMRDAFLVLRAIERGGAVVDFDVLEMNESAAQLMGVPLLVAGPRTVLGLVPSALDSGLLALGCQVLTTGRRIEGEHRTQEARTAAEWVRIQAFPLEGEDGALAVIVRDITGRKRAEVRLRDEANRDPLTGLLNRRGLDDAVHRRLREAAIEGVPDVVLYLDMDGLKAINDAYGHAEGDAALRNVASVLRRAMRAGDAVARLGGDEFVIYAPAGPTGSPERDAAELASRVQHALGAENARASESGRRYELRSSIGATTVRTGDTLERALARADEALYVDKAARRVRRAS